MARAAPVGASSRAGVIACGAPVQPGPRARWRLSAAFASWLACLTLVVLLTALIGLLQTKLPAPRLVPVYLLAVLPAAAFWGLARAVVVSVAGVVAFNFFFTPPVDQLVPSAWGDWLWLLTLMAAALVISRLAARARRQAEETALLARMATTLLECGDIGGRLDQIAAEGLGAAEAHIHLGTGSAGGADGEQYPLAVGGRQVGTITLRGPHRRGSADRSRRLPALATLLAMAIDRDQLARDAVEAETLRRSDAIKTAVLQAVSHDLRTPLMVILTSAGALARDGLALDDADRADLLGTVLEEARRLDRLVGNLLDLSRLQAGAAEPRAELVAVDDLVAAALDQVAEDADRVAASFPPDPPTVYVDSHQIERALVNLVENALKYSPASERVLIRAAATGAQAVLRVIDHGPGVAPGDAERIFAAFQRGPRTDTVRGAGLGLAIAQGFAQANGGRIWLESHARQGATFVLALPLQPAEAAR